MSDFDFNKVVEDVVKNPSRINRYSPAVNRTPLMYAIMSRDLANVKILIENGANINWQGETIKNPLGLAVEEGNFEIASYLLEKGAEIHLRGTKQKVPLDYAIQYENIPLLELLLTKPHPDTMLCDSLVRAIELNKPHFVKKLIEAGAQVNEPTTLGSFPIMTPIELRNLDMLKLLHESGADLNVYQKDDDDQTPLLKAIKMINYPFVKYLVENGAEMKAMELGGQTPLCFALETRDFRTVQVMIEAGANLDLEYEAVDEVMKINPDFAAYVHEFKRRRYTYRNSDTSLISRD